MAKELDAHMQLVKSMEEKLATHTHVWDKNQQCTICYLTQVEILTMSGVMDDVRET